MSIRPQSGVKILLPVSEKSADLTSKFQSFTYFSRTVIHKAILFHLFYSYLWALFPPRAPLPNLRRFLRYRPS